MQYFGGKFRIAKEIADLLNRYIKHTYIEPFCGGLNVSCKIKCEKAIFADVNRHLIDLYKYIQANGTNKLDPIISEEDYKFWRNNQHQSNPYIALAGIGQAFGGKWFGGYARGNSRNYALRAINILTKQFKSIQENCKEFEFQSTTYDEIELLPNAVIYCDPPYKNTVNGFNIQIFDSDKFWEWVRQNKQYFIVVSEYIAPEDFKCIKEIRTRTNITFEDRIERLFVHESRIKAKICY